MPTPSFDVEPAVLNSRCSRGATWRLPIQCEDEDGDPYPLTDQSLYGGILVGNRQMDFDFSESELASGLIVLLLTDEQTGALPVGEYGLKLWWSQGGEQKPLIGGTFTLTGPTVGTESPSADPITLTLPLTGGPITLRVLAGSSITISGPGGGGDFEGTQVFVAGAALSGHRVVTLNSIGRAIYCDGATLGHAGRAIGLTTGAASNGATATIQMPGWEVTEPSWSWDTSKPVFVGLGGTLTQTIPTLAGGYAFLQVIGWPTASTKLLINPGEPVTL